MKPSVEKVFHLRLDCKNEVHQRYNNILQFMHIIMNVATMFISTGKIGVDVLEKIRKKSSRNALQDGNGNMYLYCL